MDEGAGHIIWTICYFAVLLGLSLYGLHRYCIVYLYLKYRNNIPKPLSEFKELPRVTVQLPIFNEMYVVERLLKSVSQLDYPRELLQIQVLDDSTDETRDISEAQVKELKAAGLDIELIHRTDRTGFKAGALDEGLKTCKGEFILILDADFIVPADMLKKTVHYFTDPKVGMVQTRWSHLNRDYSLLTRVQALFIDAHFVLEQVARSRAGRLFNFNGTSGLWRRVTIADAGGWEHDTLTEDLDLSYRAQLKGWRFVYENEVVTPAELPVEMNGFKSQQHRWAKGSVQTCLKLLPALWRSNLPLILKLEGTAHLTAYFICLLLVLFCVLIEPTIAPIATHSTLKFFLLDVPVFLLTSIPFMLYYVYSQRQLNSKTWWHSIGLLPFMIAMGAGVSINNARAVIEALFGFESSFVRTPKYGIEKPTESWRKRHYSPLKSVLIVAEVLFAMYFGYLTVYAAVTGAYGSLFFLGLFLLGFLYVAACSISQCMPRITFPTREREPADAVVPAQG
jgi:cellulose synthase/poly-beta-1,6-N-acetylglucosamine synthase-like glycosyltransferase